MKLDLHEIIDVPGGRVPFAQTLDVSRLDFPSVISYPSPPYAQGEVRNSAGLLRVEGELTAPMLCICDRCGRVFESEKSLALHALIVDDEDTEDPEAFTLEGDRLDLDELLETLLILDMETKFLCSEDCKGVCPSCGKNLNEGPCACGRKSDPRLAVLEQLLDKQDLE